MSWRRTVSTGIMDVMYVPSAASYPRERGTVRAPRVVVRAEYHRYALLHETPELVDDTPRLEHAALLLLISTIVYRNPPQIRIPLLPPI